MTAIVEARHLQKTYGNIQAVDDVSFEIRGAEIFGLLGPCPNCDDNYKLFIGSFLSRFGAFVLRIDGRCDITLQFFNAIC